MGHFAVGYDYRVLRVDLSYHTYAYICPGGVGHRREGVGFAAIRLWYRRSYRVHWIIDVPEFEARG